MIISNSTEPSLSKDSKPSHLTREELQQRVTKKRLNMSTGKLIEFPPLNSSDDLELWITRVEEDLMTGDAIPRSQWADAAILYLDSYKPLKMSMMQQRKRRMEAGGSDIWIWEDFQKSLSQVLGKVQIQTIQRLDLGFAY